ncbi:MAG: hypothetical protein HRT66_05370 [Flavobacteriaceae bacterium]|nr:hypothetical protein [Flavobacteriaceae bacterium]
MRIYIVIGIIVTIGVLISCTYKKEKPKTEKTTEQNPFMDMRNMAFSAKAEQIGLENITNDKVYGLITEIAMSPGTISVVSFLTGDTSLYLSSGGGFIGAGQHEEVREIVSKKVEGSQMYLSKAKRIEEPKLPNDGMVNFNFITKNGIYSVSENISDLENDKSEFSKLFEDVNEIITQIRLKSNE